MPRQTPRRGSVRPQEARLTASFTARAEPRAVRPVTGRTQATPGREGMREKERIDGIGPCLTCRPQRNPPRVGSCGNRVARGPPSTRSGATRWRCCSARAVRARCRRSAAWCRDCRSATAADRSRRARWMGSSSSCVDMPMPWQTVFPRVAGRGRKKSAGPERPSLARRSVRPSPGDAGSQAAPSPSATTQSRPSGCSRPLFLHGIR